MKISNLNRIACLMLSMLFLKVSGQASQPKKKPNIILIMVDDIGAEAFSCYGGETYKTPNVDALAKQGILFENAYAQSVCSPSRAQILTGKYPFRTDVTHNKGGGSMSNLMYEFRHDPWGLDASGKPNVTTFAHVLKKAGYKTATAGKWGLAQFDHTPQHLEKMGFDKYRAWARIYNDKFLSKYWNPCYWEDGKAHLDVKDVYGPNGYTDYLIDFMKENKDKPFLLYYPMTLVHSMNQNPYENPIPEGVDHPNFKQMEKYTVGGYDGKDFKLSVQYMDKLVGKIVKAVDDLGIADNTLIIFTADNGSLHQQRFVYKGKEITGGKGIINHTVGVGETGTHIPFIVRWPEKIKEASVKDDLIDFADILPTFAELSGQTTPKDLDGVSFAPLLLGKKRKKKEAVFAQFKQWLWVRNKSWALNQKGDLFDLREDRHNIKPADKDASRAHRVNYKRLSAEMNKYKEDALRTYEQLGDFYNEEEQQGARKEIIHQ
ncbi:arylsulfatase (plasmid) [Fulvitalea axinellae]|uniref:Arylsulfatase n=1 Tax=Fulvitalea axinellae TaxID=1182444 RepID=A0AAU9DN90_9BACT|nr:arylsulfatase [Fulvitalea axinellae]